MILDPKTIFDVALCNPIISKLGRTWDQIDNGDHPEKIQISFSCDGMEQTANSGGNISVLRFLHDDFYAAFGLVDNDGNSKFQSVEGIWPLAYCSGADDLDSCVK